MKVRNDPREATTLIIRKDRVRKKPRSEEKKLDALVPKAIKRND